MAAIDAPGVAADLADLGLDFAEDVLPTDEAEADDAWADIRRRDKLDLYVVSESDTQGKLHFGLM